MRSRARYVVLGALLNLAWLPLAHAAKGDAQSMAKAADGVLRVGGDYTVQSVEQGPQGTFHVVFQAVHPSGRFDILKLDSDHVHVAVKVGQTIRLSAEILSQEGNQAEVAQMVIFLPSCEGHVPVWLLSTKAAHTDLRASKYLEMHVPANDFMIM